MINRVRSHHTIGRLAAAQTFDTRVGAIVLAAVLCGAVNAAATPIPVGVFVFDSFVAGPDGTNAFLVVNLTGDPSTGGFALPPDFPVVTAIAFESPRLVWDGPGGSPFGFGGVPITPGYVDPPFEIQFADTDQLISASFSASIDSGVLLTEDGRTFQVDAQTLFANLAGPNGFLAPGESAVLTVEAAEISTPVAPTPVPEPASLVLIATAVSVVTARRKRRANHA